MPAVPIIAAVIAVAGSAVVANQQKQAAKGAANAQTAAAQAGINEQKSQYESVKKLMEPYTTAGPEALASQQALLGLSGPEAQQKAIAAIESGPQFTSLLKQGENAMLQNASATGGLRGGNVQAALGQFRPQLLSQLIDQQYGRLGQISTLGQAAAAGQAAQGMQQGQIISGLLGQQGQAQAGYSLAQGAANAQAFQQLSSLAATYAGKKF